MSTTTATLSVADLRLLAKSSWVLALRADHRSPATIAAYSEGVRLYLDWCEREEVDPLSRVALRAWVASLLDRGQAPTTGKSRMQAVRRFAAWLVAEGEIPGDPFTGIKPPKMDRKMVDPLSDDQLRALIRACTPPKGAAPLGQLTARRDEAILRLMSEGLLRAGEVVALTVADIDLAGGSALVRRGKGGKARRVPFGPQTARAIDRYLRLRRHHRLADSPDLWLGDHGHKLAYEGLYKSLRGRAQAAGVEGFHPHLLRHTGAHRWLAAGGSEQSLMAIAGWERPDMLATYTRARASDRAAEEARRLNLGDL